MIPVNIDLVEEAESLIPIQFYNKPNFTQLIKEYVEELQTSNDTVFDILDQLNVEDSTGYLLDCVGSYVAVLRNSDDDETYRERIIRRILSGSSEGTPNDLLELIQLVSGGNSVKIWEHFPVSTFLSTNGTRIPRRILESTQNASPTSSGRVTILLNPFNNCFIPSELGFDVLKLASRELNPFVTNLNENIVVNQLIYGGVEQFFAELSEYTYGIENGLESRQQDFKGILCEIVYYDGGVITYNHDYVELDNTILYWYQQMNFSTPQQFS